MATIEQLYRDIADKTTHDLGYLHNALMGNASHFTCHEAEMIADLYRRYGMEDRAASFIEEHALGDEEGDAHYQGAEPVETYVDDDAEYHETEEDADVAPTRQGGGIFD